MRSSLSNYIDKQKNNELMINKLTLDLEIYENDLYNLGEDVCNEKIRLINNEITEIKTLIKKYKFNYGKLNDEEKFIIGKIQKGITLIEIAHYYYDNQEQIINIKSYKKMWDKKIKIDTIKRHLYEFTKNIIKKLEMSIE
ncbi:MAG: hypothetical protein GX309_06165 [Clostridiales bacterium]|nr:hypothetical protein [Clostridiales bacterium]